MAAIKFTSSHNMVAFLDKPTESDGFEQIVAFLNAHPIKYALTVNPTIYTSCIEQFWTTTKVKTVNGEVQIQALVDKKKVIVTETSVRSDLQLEDAKGTECLPNATNFEQLTLMGYENLTQKLTFYKAFFSPQWKFLIHTILQCLNAKTTTWNEFSSTMASVVIYLATNQKFNFSKYIFDNMVKNLEGGVKFLMYPRRGKDFAGRDTPLFPTMIVQAQEQEGEEPIADETENVESIPTHSNDPLLSELQEIESSKDEGLGDQEDASKQGRKIADIDADEEVTLIDETYGRNDDNLMFDIGVLDEQEVEVEKDKDKGKEKMVEPEKPLKKKDQILIDDEIAQRLQEELQVELEEEERLARQKEEDANIAK
ncbi:hypothetical protein Tco_1413074 [Tanacetum coccineum]